MSTEHNDRPWIAYVGPFPYPEGAAASRRVYGVAQSLVLAGYAVVVASGDADRAADASRLVVQAQGIQYCHVPERVAERWPVALRHLRYAWMGQRTVAWLDSRPRLPAAVILYSGYTPYLQRLLPWCHRRGVPLLFDAVEWYEPARRFGYVTSPYQWNIEWAMRRLVPKVDGVIAISSYLANYYRRRGLRVAMVPPTTSDIPPGDWHPDRARLRLCYAGQPGSRKDDLAAVIGAVAALVAGGASIELTVAGPTRKQVLGMVAAGRRDPEWLQTPGWLPPDAVHRLMGGADFSVLIRRRCRTTEAGFSTKFVESLAVGTPVIGTLTGDLGEHLRDGQTGIVSATASVPDVQRAVARALALAPNDLRRMRAEARAHAGAVFHPRVYADTLRGLLNRN